MMFDFLLIYLCILGLCEGRMIEWKTIIIIISEWANGQYRHLHINNSDISVIRDAENIHVYLSVTKIQIELQFTASAANANYHW